MILSKKRNITLKRRVIDELVEWKNSEDRKPLILKGARQVGKTWALKHFAEENYENYIYINFEEEKEISSIFEASKNPKRIVERLSLLKGQPIKEEKTLLIFDEIQYCPDALNSLKYFKENANGFHVAAAGSLLGTLLASPGSYPVGSVNVINVYPLTFDEFLEATDGPLFNYYCKIERKQKIEDIFHTRLIDAYNSYLIIGGMPECVSSWCKYKDSEKVDAIQEELITLYENDITKHNKKINSARILMVLRSIPSQLGKGNEKFMYGAVKQGGRAREFEEAIEWLVSAGLVNRVHNVSKPEHPLPAFDILDSFKLFFFDTGLLKHMAGIDNKAILLRSAFQYKGPLTENYVLQQLIGQFKVNPRYYAEKNMEIDFLIQKGTDIIPIEVKAGEDKSAPSFKRFIAENNPEVAIRYSKLGYLKNGAITNIPLYLARKTKELIK